MKKNSLGNIALIKEIHTKLVGFNDFPLSRRLNEYESSSKFRK